MTLPGSWPSWPEPSAVTRRTSRCAGQWATWWRTGSCNAAAPSAARATARHPPCSRPTSPTTTSADRGVGHGPPEPLPGDPEASGWKTSPIPASRGTILGCRHAVWSATGRCGSSGRASLARRLSTARPPAVSEHAGDGFGGPGSRIRAFGCCASGASVTAPRCSSCWPRRASTTRSDGPKWCRASSPRSRRAPPRSPRQSWPRPCSSRRQGADRAGVRLHGSAGLRGPSKDEALGHGATVPPHRAYRPLRATVGLLGARRGAWRSPTLLHCHDRLDGLLSLVQ